MNNFKHLFKVSSIYTNSYSNLRNPIRNIYFLFNRGNNARISNDNQSLIKCFINKNTQYVRLNSNQTPPLSTKEKLKKAVAEYGSTVIIFHSAISLASLGICYSLVSSGVDLAKFVEYLAMSDETTKKLTTKSGTFVVAYAIHKCFVPVRMGMTLACTPLIVRFLRSKGILKHPPKAK